MMQQMPQMMCPRVAVTLVREAVLWSLAQGGHGLAGMAEARVL